MERSLSNLEHRALLCIISTVLNAEHRNILCDQLQRLTVRDRANSRPWGFYTDFEPAQSPRIPVPDAEFNKHPPSVWGQYKNQHNPISFVLYIKDGMMDYLEADTVMDEWPDDENTVTFDTARHEVDLGVASEPNHR